MTYLINPLWIYLIDVLTNIDVFALIGTPVGVAAIIVFGVYFWLCMSDGYDDEDAEYKISKQGLKISIIITIVLILFMCVVPSEKTMYTMFVSSYVTEENLEIAGQSVTQMVDYIFEKVDELQD